MYSIIWISYFCRWLLSMMLMILLWMKLCFNSWRRSFILYICVCIRVTLVQCWFMVFYFIVKHFYGFLLLLDLIIYLPRFFLFKWCFIFDRFSYWCAGYLMREGAIEGVFVMFIHQSCLLCSSQMSFSFVCVMWIWLSNYVL